MAAKRGRPPALDETKKEVVIGLVAVGCSWTVAARYVGVHRETIRTTAGRDAQFGRKLAQAEAAMQWSHLRNISQASGRSWRASAWALERLNPQQFGRRRAETITRNELDAAIDGLAKVLAEGLIDTDTQRHVLRRLEEIHQSLTESNAA